jgi:tRNA(fMet)-specific endonuclease VapC
VSALAWLLDTNVLSDLIREPDGPVAARLRAVGEAAVGTSIVVACELRFGAATRGSAILSAKVEDLLANLSIAQLAPPTDRHYGEVRRGLERAGTPIGPNDLLIAAHALALGATLVTRNTVAFSRVPGLAVEDWTAPPPAG